MALEQDLIDLMWERISHAAFTSYDSAGAPTYATATSHPARIERKAKLVRTVDGREVVATTKVLMGPSTSSGALPGVTAQSKLTLPDGTSPTVLMVYNARDDVAAYYECAWCG